uniref:Uncharacterized protein n=1 Tax=Chromera velia CCMP2878 TaxID=1169474 RepID=A0A0G4HT06_9ALVE|eukprot:Cvel_8343.t1-p1 / transcript=Cvel_8343.t1 / gene=Cvel_8343 / organism=Chromera_velia_CCMP2878 / gene_product=hypothetical protein / transcript_product=hypothetical protein / location=Cvel_scaffold459:44266-45866(+) / protein_length=305 / sequence_SO=supercontig / SO=protein_coding / is_pseudo=false
MRAEERVGDSEERARRIFTSLSAVTASCYLLEALQARCQSLAQRTEKLGAAASRQMEKSKRRATRLRLRQRRRQTRLAKIQREREGRARALNEQVPPAALLSLPLCALVNAIEGLTESLTSSAVETEAVRLDETANRARRLARAAAHVAGEAAASVKDCEAHLYRLEGGLPPEDARLLSQRPSLPVAFKESQRHAVTGVGVSRRKQKEKHKREGRKKKETNTTVPAMKLHGVRRCGIHLLRPPTAPVPKAPAVRVTGVNKDVSPDAKCVGVHFQHGGEKEKDGRQTNLQVLHPSSIAEFVHFLEL